eukprot:scaffold923_cov171-Amphora_coffeaeformis.AAC.11
MKFPLTPAEFLASFANQTNTNAQTGEFVQHPDEHPFEPIFLRQYYITQDEIDAPVPACEADTNDCDWSVIITLRDEKCIPGDYPIRSHDDTNYALICPLLVEGYSHYPTEDTSPGVLPFKYHLYSIPGVELPVFLLPRTKFACLVGDNPDYTYEDLMNWVTENDDIYRGKATSFSELHFYNIQQDVENEGAFYMQASGDLPGGLAFDIKIEEMGDNYEPVLWEVDIVDPSKEGDGLDGGVLASVVIAAFVLGAVLALAVAWKVLRGNTTQRRRGQGSSSHPHHQGKGEVVEETESTHYGESPQEVLPGQNA